MAKGYVKAVSVVGILMMLLALVPAGVVSAAPSVDGRPDIGNYSVYGYSPGGRGTLYYALDGSTLYVMMVVDETVNDNVFGKDKDAGDKAYVATAGWGKHSFKDLVNSDHINLTLTCGTDSWTWQQDYAYDADGDKNPLETDWKSDYLGNDGGGTPPPGIIASSSLAWNLNNTLWDVTLGGNRTGDKDYKSPDDVQWPPSDNDVTNNGWPGYDSTNVWEWQMVYEMSMNVPSCASNPILITVNSAHNSPSKDGTPDVPVYPKDCGDNPDPPYPTTGGACHTIPTDSPYPYMGNTIDSEPDGQPNGLALGDDAFDSWDDEDGLVDPDNDLDLMDGEIPQVRVVVTNPTGSTATLYGWIDFNGDGVFENATERASVTVPPGTDHATVILVFPAMPEDWVESTFARFRLSTDGVAANPTGLAYDGEVEDYPVNIQPTLVEVSSFGAFEDGGRAVVFWETASEMDTVGFNLLRLDEATGKYAQVGPFVPSLFDSAGGMYYTVDDTARPGGVYTYKLVEIGFGGETVYGPYTAKVYRSQGR